jgi:hypothetical protein
MVITFPRLQRMSGLENPRPQTIREWLKREGIPYSRDATGKPWTTLDALNRKLQRASDDGFTLEDPEGGLPEERPMVSRRPQSLDRAVQGGRRAAGTARRIAGRADRTPANDHRRTADGLPTASRTSAGDTP